MYPLLRIHRLDATGTVSKYLIFSALTSSPSCSIQHLKRSPSSDWSKKKNAPYNHMSSAESHALYVAEILWSSP